MAEEGISSSGPSQAGTPSGVWRRALVSSTSAEASAVAAALRVVNGELLGDVGLNIWVVFYSMALHERLRNPRRNNIDPPTAEASRLLHLLAQQHTVTVVWVPGHAGLPLNTQADEQGPCYPSRRRPGRFDLRWASSAGTQRRWPGRTTTWTRCHRRTCTGGAATVVPSLSPARGQEPRT